LVVPFGWPIGGTTKSAGYGLGIRLAAIRDALLARTVCSNGRARAAAPSADTLSTSRRDRVAELMIEVGHGRPTTPGTHRGSLLESLVFARTLAGSTDPSVEVVADDPVKRVRALKHEPGAGLWLVGGGSLAGALYDEIDELILKIAPITIGAGVPLFGGTDTTPPRRHGERRRRRAARPRPQRGQGKGKALLADQRLGRSHPDDGATQGRAHLDFGTDGIAAEVRRPEALSARVLGPDGGFVVLHEPLSCRSA
jgi:hypothetical protein